MNKPTLKQSAWAKAVAFILCIAMIPLFIGNLFLYTQGTLDGAYSSGEKVSFYKSEICRELVMNELNSVLYWDFWESEPVSGTDSEPVSDADNEPVASVDDPEEGAAKYTAGFYFYDAPTRLLVQVTDENGKTVAQNCNGEKGYQVYDRLLWLELQDGSSYYVSVWVEAESGTHDILYFAEHCYNTAYTLRNWFIPLALISAVLLIAAFVFLMVSAGHHKGCDGVRAGWQEKIPLDIYLVLAVGICVLAVLAIHLLLDSFRYITELWQLIVAALAILCVILLSVCLGTCVTIVARFKMGRYFYRHTVIYYVLRWVGGLIKKYIALPLKSLPLVLKTAIITAGILLVNLILVVFSNPWNGFPVFLMLLLYIAIFLAVLVVAAQLRRLETAGKELASGNIDYKTDTVGLLPDFKAHAENLNSISEGMNLAVAERMKSERFKTELITNVSHDLKTPLTSIINYVDLLSREDLQNEKAAEYIEVLQRQAQRLKKLTDDLVDASKASSGAVSVDMRPTNVCELLNQAVAEYSDRLGQQQITPVMTLPEYDITIMADGRLLWRVFDNFLSNIRKYSMPGTRAYISVSETDDGTDIAFRNISRDQLNVSADELMERFVRGDASRSTEGSGLGLNIARSLTELMGGDMRLTVDGDLFKAEVIFPTGGAAESGTPAPEQPVSPEQPALAKQPAAESATDPDGIKSAAADLMRRVKDKVRKAVK